MTKSCRNDEVSDGIKYFDALVGFSPPLQTASSLAVIPAKAGI
ncbi:hypothetical protein [Neisseria polysaccharea]|nr:hypothetical protein [Neisseria polysaccharea]